MHSPTKAHSGHAGPRGPGGWACPHIMAPAPAGGLSLGTVWPGPMAGAGDTWASRLGRITDPARPMQVTEASPPSTPCTRASRRGHNTPARVGAPGNTPRRSVPHVPGNGHARPFRGPAHPRQPGPRPAAHQVQRGQWASPGHSHTGRACRGPKAGAKVRESREI